MQPRPLLLIVAEPVPGVADLVCSDPLIVTVPLPAIGIVAPAPGSSTSISRPKPSEHDFRLFPASSVTIVPTALALALQVWSYTVRDDDPSGCWTRTVRPKAS